MTSSSLESGPESSGPESSGPGSVRPGPVGSAERIGLPGQPECTASGRSDPAAALSVGHLRAHADELGFSPQDQVRWLAPVQLLTTAAQVLLAAAFSSFTDKRELQRSFPADPLALAADPDGGCWLDFTADTGDGFDSTYTVASLLAAEQLEVTGPTGELYRLPRGRLLVLGGDEVYPTASSERYEDRLKGPLRTALHPSDVTSAPDAGQGGPVGPPLLVALPGNHDWYDGLTAFLRVFAQRRRIGGWQTVQGRSYFVMQLPGGWWLAGLDTQLGSEIDDPQLEFFRTQLTERLQPGDGVILCCAAPTWIRTTSDARAFDSFHYFERTVITHSTDPATGRIRPTGAQVRLWITGDKHHYARYAESPGSTASDSTTTSAGSEPGSSPTGQQSAPEREHERVDQPVGSARQLITAGLGGAYLSATHRLPEKITLPPPGSTECRHGPQSHYRLAARWPSAAASRRRVRGLFSLTRRGLPLRNPGFWHLAGWVHAGLFLMLISLLGVIRQEGPITAIRGADLIQVGQLIAQLASWWAIILVISSVVASIKARRLTGPPLLVPAVGLQLLVAAFALIAVVWLVGVFSLPTWFPGGQALPNYVLLALLLAAVAPLAGLVGSYAVALTLALSRDRMVSDWQFSAQSIEDCKGFIRLRIEPDGRLLVHPVVVDTVVRRWQIGPDPTDQGPPRRIRPATGLPPAYLVEEPVLILRSPDGTAS